MGKKISLYLLCSLLGAIFIFSGYAKLYPIEPFEYTFVDLGFINWQTAPFIARILIGLELLIGFLLLFNIFLRPIAYKLSIGCLLIFSIYLIFLITINGNKGDCGCFGSYFHFTPLQSFFKNILLFGFLFILTKNHYGWEIKKNKNILRALFFVSAFTLPFILNPIELNYSEAYLHKSETDYKIELDSLYNNATLNNPPKELSTGKHIIAFLSLTCPHCRIAANKMRIIKQRNSKIPFYFVFNGKEKDLNPFFENTNTKNIPHCMLLGRNFVYLAGTNLPVIYFVNNSIVENEINYVELDQIEIEKWLNQ